MLSQNFVKQFAEEWIAAWNARDLPRILSHYSDELEMSSPYIAQLLGQPSGTLKGKVAVGAYWGKALERAPDLCFELIEALAGVDSVVICYRSARGMAAEVFFFDANDKVIKSCAHYA